MASHDTINDKNEKINNTNDIYLDPIVDETTDNEAIIDENFFPKENFDEGDVLGYEDSEVQVLGVAHEGQPSMNIGTLSIDGQDVVMIDIDTNETFDIAIADLNADGQIDENEIVQLPEGKYTIESLGGYDLAPHGNGNIFTTNDTGIIDDGMHEI